MLAKQVYWLLVMFIHYKTVFSYGNNVKSLMIYKVIIKHAKSPYSLIKSQQQIAEVLARSFPSLALHLGILDLSCLLILLVYTKHKTKRWNFRLTLRPHFTSLKLCKCSQIRVVLTPNRTKTNDCWLNHLQILHAHLN